MYLVKDKEDDYMMDKAKCIDIYLKQQDKNLKEATIKGKLKVIKQFLDYCIANEIGNIRNIQKNDVYGFVQLKNWASQSRSSAQFTIRDFFNVMKKQELVDYDGYELYPIIFTNKRSKILSYYSPEEISKIINSIDLTNECGIRDKCMVLIAAETGLRASDIVFLKFSEIKWDKNIIQKIQMKTKQPIEVPISDNIKYLLLDYLKNHRVSDDSEYIFINTQTSVPFNDAAVLTHTVRKAFIKANINIRNKKAGAHSLRHSLATNLLKNNTPLPVIKGILGHTNISTTEKYLSIDIEGLRMVSLEVPL